MLSSAIRSSANLRISVLCYFCLLNRRKWRLVDRMYVLTLQLMPIVVGVPCILFPSNWWPLLMLYSWIWSWTFRDGKVFLTPSTNEIVCAFLVYYCYLTNLCAWRVFNYFTKFGSSYFSYFFLASCYFIFFWSYANYLSCFSSS